MGFRPCPRCGATISSKSRKCRSCGLKRPFRLARRPVADTPPPPPEPVPAAPPEPAPRSETVDPSRTTAPAAKRGPTCTLCQGQMQKKTISSGNVTGIILGLLVFLIGLVITITIPLAGWVVGPIIMILALFMGGKRRHVWRCVDCSHVVDRAGGGTSWLTLGAIILFATIIVVAMNA